MVNTSQSVTPLSSLLTDALDVADAARREPGSYTDRLVSRVATPATDTAIDLTAAQRDDAARQRASDTWADGRAGFLQRVSDVGRARALKTIERVDNEIPTDTLVGTHTLKWGINGGATVTINGEPTRVHPHALGQATNRYGIPKPYADRLIVGEAWEKALAATTLNTHADNDKEGRLLARVTGGQLRGLLSDRYRRIDSRPLLRAFVEAIQGAGMFVYEGVASDVRISLRALLPQVFTIAGDSLLLGLSWSNSDYGAGAHNIELFVLRCLCLNGMMGSSQMKNVHLGRRLGGEDAQLSQKTYDLDTAATASALTDVVTGFGDNIQRTAETIKEAAERPVPLKDGKLVVETMPAILKRALSKDEQDRVRAEFNSQESVVLPPAPTVHRLAQTLSWVAQTTPSADRQLELERLAGTIAGL